MSIEHKILAQLSQEDLEALVTSQAAENIRLEYKRDLYGQNDNSKKELLKDISALANSHGGDLIIGIEELNGRADGLYGVRCDNPDEETLRMEQVIRSGVEPNIAGIRIRYLKLSNLDTNARRYLFIIRVPQSHYPPHRVIINNHNRFYLRNSAGVHEPDIEELRVLFASSSKPEALSNSTHQQTNAIHPLNLYGFLLNSLGALLFLPDQGLTFTSVTRWFLIGITLHTLHALLASVPFKNQFVTYYIQICILACMLLGFVSLIIGWLLSSQPS